MNRELLEIREQGRLPTNSYILYSIEDGEDPFILFEQKYGFPATEVILGNKVKINIPDGVQTVPGLSKAPTGHIYLR